LVKEKGAGSVRTAINIYNQYGIRGLYKGFAATWMRESTLGVYFGTYDALMNAFKARKMNLQAASLLSGGFAGATAWFIMYPLDFVKTRFQSDSLSNPVYKSVKQCFQTEVKAKGISVIYTGFQIMLVRAFVVNAFGFMCF
jgi:solute carrier family 25 carnitine/acylcarnitine transporter 20/29